MRPAFLFALILACASPPGRCASVSLPTGNPVATVEIPDDWNPLAFDNGVEASSPDGAVYVAIGYVDEKSVGTALDNAIKFLENHGVKVDNDTAEQRELELNGMNVVDVTWDGSDKDGACSVKLAIFGVTEADGLMLLYWAPPEVIEENAISLGAIVESIRPLSPPAGPGG